MKNPTKILSLTVFAALMLTQPLFAQLNIPSDGSDGALNITSNTVIDLSQAVTGAWDANNSANAGKGIYDPNKWAVVFKYSSVTIASNATVTFTNHASRVPVVWLVSGNVTINGILSLNGQNAGYNAPLLAEPGPGGFRGGSGRIADGVDRGAGFGPGGGRFTGGDFGSGAGGSYGTVGSRGDSPAYGNPSLIPLIGGSGGGGHLGDARGGGGGGGAILIASVGTISISGTIQANGGDNAGGGGGGSGGGIRLISSSLNGNGMVHCLGGANYVGD